MRRSLSSLVALAVAAGLAGCGSTTPAGPAPAGAPGPTDSGSAAAPAGGDPCALLTPAEAKQVFDADAAPGKRYDLPDMATCLFKSVYTPGGGLITSVTVGYYLKLHTVEDLRTLVDQGVDSSDSKQPAKALTGLGDAAYYVPGLGEVFFFTGGRVYAVTPNTKEDPEKLATRTATLMVGHL